MLYHLRSYIVYRLWDWLLQRLYEALGNKSKVKDNKNRAEYNKFRVKNTGIKALQLHKQGIMATDSRILLSITNLGFSEKNLLKYNI